MPLSASEKLASSSVSAAEVDLQRSDLAAAFRIAADLGLHEGIDNHLTYAFGDGTMLVNRFGVHWSQVCKRDILRVDFQGNFIEGQGKLDRTALFIHESIHRLCPNARAVFHTHQPYATALTCIQDGRLEPISQNALFFHERTAYLDEYQGLALDRIEGERLARAVGDSIAVFLANHGVITIGNTLAEALHYLYFLERAAMVQILAAQSGRPFKYVGSRVAKLTQQQMDQEVSPMQSDFFEAHKALLAGREPNYFD